MNATCSTLLGCIPKPLPHLHHCLDDRDTFRTISTVTGHLPAMPDGNRYVMESRRLICLVVARRSCRGLRLCSGPASSLPSLRSAGETPPRIPTAATPLC
jgi:hypothetical protein